MMTRATIPMTAQCRLAVLPLLLLLGGCLSGPPPVRYLLEPAPVDPSAVSLPASTGALPDALGLRTVALPGYVRDSAITGRGEGRRLLTDETAQWAEAPDAAVTRVLAESLRRRSGEPVLIEPLPRGFDPDTRIEVIFDRLLGNRRGGVDIAGQVRIVSGDGRQLERIVPFGFDYRAEGDGQTGYFAALAVGLDDLARLIVETLIDVPS